MTTSWRWPQASTKPWISNRHITSKTLVMGTSLRVRLDCHDRLVYCFEADLYSDLNVKDTRLCTFARYQHPSHLVLAPVRHQLASALSNYTSALPCKDMRVPCQSDWIFRLSGERHVHSYTLSSGEDSCNDYLSRGCCFDI